MTSPEFPIGKTSCEMLGITNIDISAIGMAENIARESLKETIRLANNWSVRSARKQMALVDVESAMRIMQNQGNVQRSTIDTQNYGIDQLAPVSGTSGLFSFANSDVEVDKEDNETCKSVPRHVRVLTYMLVNEGQPTSSDFTMNADEEDEDFFEKRPIDGVSKGRSEEVNQPEPRKSCIEMFQSSVKSIKGDQKVGLKPPTVEMLTVEQQVFMKEIITVCMGQDDKKRHEALYTLETDAGLQVLLPHLTQRICKSISANISQRCLSLIIYAVRVLRSISYNKACDMTVTLHDVLPALLSCCVGRNMCLRPESDNHWALRDFSAKTLVGIVREQIDKRDNGQTCRRLANFAFKVFKSASSSFSMIYGTVHLLQEFVEPDRTRWLLGELAEMAGRCKSHVEAANGGQRMVAGQQLSVTEAAKLSQQVAKCESVLKARMARMAMHK